MSLRLRVGILIAVIGLILVGSTVTMVATLRNYDGQRAAIRDALLPASVAARGMLTALVNQETGERGFLITGQESFLRPYHRGRAAFAASYHSLEQDFRADDVVRGQLHMVWVTVQSWHRSGVQPEIDARRAGHVARAQSLVEAGRSKDEFDVIRREVATLQAMIDSRLAHARTIAGDAFTALRNQLILSRVVFLLLVLVLALALRRWVLRPVTELRADMREVAAGRLDQPVRQLGPREVAGIAQDAESMRRRILQELDSARAATEALQQHSPVVTGLRSELAARPVDGNDALRVYGVLHPAEGVLAGDWWETVPRRDGSFAVMVADVAGHGAEAGLVALRFKQRITVLMRTDLDLLTAFTTAAVDLDDDDERFLSCVLVEVEPTTGLVRWINAGHSAALIARRIGNDVAVEDLVPTGPLIGGLGTDWAVQETRLATGDLLLAMTDGVVEARRGVEEFGIDGVVRTLAAVREWSPQATVTELVQAVRLFADDWQRDDVTCVGVDLRP